jgi:hypothetical protein
MGAPWQQDERIEEGFLPNGMAQRGLVVGGVDGKLFRQSRLSFIVFVG